MKITTNIKKQNQLIILKLHNQINLIKSNLITSNNTNHISYHMQPNTSNKTAITKTSITTKTEISRKFLHMYKQAMLMGQNVHHP